MTDDATQGRGEPSWALRIAIGGPLGLGGLYALAMLGGHPSGFAEFGQLGDAFAPLTVVFSIAAVAVALRSVELQRSELALQRQELRANRKEMKEQRKQFEKTAHAQADLASSQRLLAQAQVEANVLSKKAVLAQHRATGATITAAVAQIHIAVEEMRQRNPANGDALEKRLKPISDICGKAMEIEGKYMEGMFPAEANEKTTVGGDG